MPEPISFPSLEKRIWRDLAPLFAQTLAKRGLGTPGIEAITRAMKLATAEIELNIGLTVPCPAECEPVVRQVIAEIEPKIQQIIHTLFGRMTLLAIALYDVGGATELDQVTRNWAEK